MISYYAGGRLSLNRADRRLLFRVARQGSHVVLLCSGLRPELGTPQENKPFSQASSLHTTINTHYTQRCFGLYTSTYKKKPVCMSPRVLATMSTPRSTYCCKTACRLVYVYTAQNHTYVVLSHRWAFRSMCPRPAGPFRGF